MADVQTTYTENQAVGFEGMKVDGMNYAALTRINESATPILFGKAVQRGAADDGCQPATSGMTAATFYGIAARDQSVRYTPAGGYPQRANVTVITSGAVWVKMGEAVAQGSAAAQAPLFDTATGLWMTTAGAGRVAAPGWIIDSTAALNGLAQLVKR